MTPHILRHTAITWAMQVGVDLYVASKFFGVSPAELKRIYGHLHSDHHMAVSDALTRR